LKTSPTLPTTSGAIQSEYLEIFEKARNKASAVLVIVISSDLSAAYNSALNAKQMAPDMTIEIIDSRIATLSMGFAVIEAAKAALAGGSLQEVAAKAWQVIAKAHLFVALDTLDYLRRGGRVNFPSAIMAKLLQVKPVLTLRNGKAEPVARPRTKRRALETLLKLMQEKLTGTPLHAAVMHGDAPEEAEYLEKEIKARFSPIELLISRFTPVMGAHTGPGLYGIAFYNE
jgi:DegV family protein with EDD domain